MYSQPMKSVFISGNFSVLHPGHIRLFHLAKGLGEKLVVGINSDESVISSMKVPLNLRIESLKSIEMVDEVIVINSNLKETLNKLKPDFVLKGKEHEHSHNLEEEILNGYGGKLVFGSGDFAMSSEDYLLGYFSKSAINNRDLVTSFFKRHNIKKERIISLLTSIKSLKLLVVGDLIIDEYIDCESIGLSQEDPAVVFRPISEKKFVGGAGIVALHSASIGVNTSFLTYAGSDGEANFARSSFDTKNINSYLIVDGLRSTILKKRFRAGGKTQFRLTIHEDSAISNNSRSTFLEKATEMMDNVDVLIFSDFNYGLLDKDTVDKLIRKAKQKDIFIAADCQISSQIADYLKYSNVDLVTPTEHEARVTLRDNSSGLAKIAIAFQELLNVPKLFITLGHDGLLFQESSGNQKSPFITDLIPALANKSVDTAGAGDSMLVFASLALAAGSTISEAGYLGSLAAGIQVSRVGNTPLTISEILEAI
jgi:rfaE bifunctional protein kinase chain/domain